MPNDPRIDDLLPHDLLEKALLGFPVFRSPIGHEEKHTQRHIPEIRSVFFFSRKERLLIINGETIESPDVAVTTLKPVIDGKSGLKRFRIDVVSAHLGENSRQEKNAHLRLNLVEGVADF